MGRRALEFMRALGTGQQPPAGLRAADVANPWPEAGVPAANLFTNRDRQVSVQVRLRRHYSNPEVQRAIEELHRHLP